MVALIGIRVWGGELRDCDRRNAAAWGIARPWWVWRRRAASPRRDHGEDVRADGERGHSHAQRGAQPAARVLARSRATSTRSSSSDGRSTDNTIDVARALMPEIVVVHETRRGKGAGLQAGFGAATGDIIVMLDADGSADPAEIPRFVEALVAGADFAKGSRYLAGGGSADLTRHPRASATSGLTALVNLLYGTRYTDLCYGYNAFWRHCLPYLEVDCDGFEVETLINIRIAKAGLRVAEVPSFEERAHPRREQPAADPRRLARAAHDHARALRRQGAARGRRSPTPGPTRDSWATRLLSSWRISESRRMASAGRSRAAGRAPSPATRRSAGSLRPRSALRRCAGAEDRVRLPALRPASRWDRAPRRADRDADGGGRRRGRGAHAGARRAPLPHCERIGRVLVRRFAMRLRARPIPFAPGLFAHLASHRRLRHRAQPQLSRAAGARRRCCNGGRPTVFTPHYHGPGHTRLASALHRVYGPLGSARRAQRVDRHLRVGRRRPTSCGGLPPPRRSRRRDPERHRAAAPVVAASYAGGGRRGLDGRAT